MFFGAVMRILDIRAIRNMCLKYDPDLLREIGQGAKFKANYHLFSLKYELRMKIIDLDIRKKVMLYKRSRAGKRLYHKIATISMKPRLHRPSNRTLVQGNNVNIVLTVNGQCRKTIEHKCATVNCCSIVNKTADFKLDSWNITDVCASHTNLDQRR